MTITEPARMSYRMSPEDSQLVALAAQTFADDYRYLLDMVTTAGKAERAASQTSETCSPHSSRDNARFYAEVASAMTATQDGAS